MLSRGRRHLYIGFRILFIILLLVISYLAFSPAPFPVMNTSDKIQHAFAFFVLAAIVDFSFRQRAFRWLKIIPLLVYAPLIEFVQLYIPNRDFSLLDILADLVGVGAYWLLILVGTILYRRRFALAQTE